MLPKVMTATVLRVPCLTFTFRKSRPVAKFRPLGERVPRKHPKQINITFSAFGKSMYTLCFSRLLISLPSPQYRKKLIYFKTVYTASALVTMQY